MRIIVADCAAEYSGRLQASLPRATRVLLIKADNSLLIFSELGSYKPLNWLASPCTIHDITPSSDDDSESSADDDDSGTGAVDDVPDVSGADDNSETGASDDSGEEAVPSEAPERIIRACAAKSNDILEVTLYRVISDESYDLGEDPGLRKEGVEDHLQRYLAEQIERIGEGATLVRREYPTAIGPVDIMAIDGDGMHVAIEIKRHGGIDGVEQLTRYVKLLNKDPLLAPVRGMFAAQTITPQARTLATERGFECLLLDYDEMRGADTGELRLF